METKKVLKITGIILAIILSIYVILVLVKKYSDWGKANLGKWVLGEQEQENFRYSTDFVGNPNQEYFRQVGTADQAGSGIAEYYRQAVGNPDAGGIAEYYRQTIPQAPPMPEMQSVPMRPNLTTASPVYGRFDPNQLASNLTAQSAAPMNMMASTPSSSPLDIATYDGVDFQNLGGAGAPIPSGSLTTQQASDMLRDKVGGGMPTLQDTKDLMPVPDMRYTTGLDPTDPQNFMYDRTIFGRLKRRYGNGVDFFRGDVDVKPEYRGWFDLQPPTETDVVRGYFDNYIDIEQETAIRDSQFTRATTVENLYKSSVNPGGASYLTRYNDI